MIGPPPRSPLFPYTPLSRSPFQKGGLHPPPPLKRPRGTGARPPTRPAARHARPPDSQSALSRADARVGDLRAHPSSLARNASDPTRLVVPGTASARAPPLDQCLVGRVRQQSPSEVLPAHARGT